MASVGGGIGFGRRNMHEMATESGETQAVLWCVIASGIYVA